MESNKTLNKSAQVPSCPIQAEQDFYNAHKKEFIEKYLGKEVLIYQGKLQGVFDSSPQALDYALENGFALNKFMIRTVREKEVKVRICGMWRSL